MAVTKLVLVRHGESTWNHSGRYQGRIDSDPSELGRYQATITAERLRSIPFQAVYSSPLRRALHTANAIALSHNLSVQVDEDLIEIDHGAWNGLLKEEVQERYGPLFQAWLTIPGQVTMPHGESLEDVQRRGRRAIDRVLTEHDGETVALCSHNAVLKVIIADLLNIGLDQFWTIAVDNASISMVEFTGNRPCLIAMNDTCHLGECHSRENRQAK